MKRIAIAMALVSSTFFMVGCGSGHDGPDGEDVWYEVQDNSDDRSTEIPARCLDIKVSVYEGGDLDMGKDSINTYTYCLEDE